MRVKFRSALIRTAIFVGVFALALTIVASDQKSNATHPQAKKSLRPLFVLVHSPLVGQTTWSLVAQELRRKGFEVVVPTLNSDQRSKKPYWQAHVEQVVRSLRAIPPNRSLILVAHSGAGVLLPAIRKALRRPVAEYIFVDAIAPVDNKSRLALFDSEESANEFRRRAVNGYIPVWSDKDLREEIPDSRLRRRFVSELKHLPIAIYEEPIPVFANWPDSPCGYLQFTESYNLDAARLRDKGCIYMAIKGSHFQMLVDAPAVAKALLNLTRRL